MRQSQPTPDPARWRRYRTPAPETSGRVPENRLRKVGCRDEFKMEISGAAKDNRSIECIPFCTPVMPVQCIPVASAGGSIKGRDRDHRFEVELKIIRVVIPIVAIPPDVEALGDEAADFVLRSPHEHIVAHPVSISSDPFHLRTMQLLRSFDWHGEQHTVVACDLAGATQSPGSASFDHDETSRIPFGRACRFRKRAVRRIVSHAFHPLTASRFQELVPCRVRERQASINLSCS